MSGDHEDHEALPFPAGSSPFRIKGLVYRGHADYVASFIPGGEQAVIDALRTPELRAFFDQRFLAASWYDALPLVPVWHVCAKLLEQDATEFLEVRTRHQALRDIHGVYRFILKLSSAEAIAVRAPRILQQYFDFGTTEAAVVTPGVVQAIVRGVPSLLVPWMRIVAETFLRVALELAGVRRLHVRRLPVDPDGLAHGIRVASGRLRDPARSLEGRIYGDGVARRWRGSTSASAAIAPAAARPAQTTIARRNAPT